jgi:hypothetical protein
MERTMQQMLQQLLAMQEKEEAKMKADRGKIQAEMEAIQAETRAMRDKRMETRRDNRKNQWSAKMQWRTV